MPQHEARGFGDRDGRGARVGSGEPGLDRAQQDLVVGEDHVLFGPERAEERAAPDARAVGDVVHRRLVVAALLEQRERGLGQPLLCRFRGHRATFRTHAAASLIGRGSPGAG